MLIVQIKTQPMRPEISFQSSALPSFYSALTELSTFIKNI